MRDLPSADPYLPGHGDPAWSADHYRLDLRYDVAANRLDAETTVRLHAVTELDRIVLDLVDGLSVTAVTVDGAPANAEHRDHRLTIELHSPLSAGVSVVVTVRYGGQPDELDAPPHGRAGWRRLSDGASVAAEPHGSPTWFPCNDRPDDKASYEIRVVVPSGYTAIGNGDLVEHSTRDGEELWVWNLDVPMSTYLATLQIAHYDVRSQSDRIRLVVPAELTDEQEAGIAASFGPTPQMMECFENLFGPYPFASYTAVINAEEREIPLESTTLATFGANFMRDHWDSQRLVSHELAHQWFGNSVTVRRWSDIWLHEGFACYSEWLWSQAAGLDSTDARARVHYDGLAAKPQDVVLGDPGPADMFDDRIYKRGACTLHALRLTVGDAAFFALLRDWLAEHANGTVTTPQFRAFAAAHTGMDLEELFTAWLDRPELPRLPSAD